MLCLFVRTLVGQGDSNRAGLAAPSKGIAGLNPTVFTLTPDERASAEVYGWLYSIGTRNIWNSKTDDSGLCPKAWHVMTPSDYLLLGNTIGNTNITNIETELTVGDLMKSKDPYTAGYPWNITFNTQDNRMLATILPAGSATLRTTRTSWGDWGIVYLNDTEETSTINHVIFSAKRSIIMARTMVLNSDLSYSLRCVRKFLVHDKKQ